MPFDIFSTDPAAGGRFPIPFRIVVNLPTASDLALRWDDNSKNPGTFGGNLAIKRLTQIEAPRSILEISEKLVGFGVLPGLSIFEITPARDESFRMLEVTARTSSSNELGEVVLSIQTLLGLNDQLSRGPLYVGSIVTMPKVGNVRVVAQSNASELYIFAG